MPGSDKPLTVSQVAERLACDPRTVRAEIERGRLPAFRVGHNWRVTPEALADYMTPLPPVAEAALPPALPDAAPARRRTPSLRRTFRERVRGSLAPVEPRG
jgi:excisionase family DNA binding protein